MIIQFAVRTFGPILLQGGLGGGGGATGGTNSQKADDDFDDFDDDSSENDVDADKDKVAISLPTYSPEKLDGTSLAAFSAPSASVDAAPDRIDLFGDDSFDDDTSSSSTQSSLSLR